MEDELRPRTNYAWANAADCLKEEKQIRITMLLNNIQGIELPTKKRFLELYKWTSQSIHGSSVGINLSFNDFISYDINDLHTKNADYFAGGISTVISTTMLLFIRTFKIYFNVFPDGGLNIKNPLEKLSAEYVKMYKAICN